VPRATLQTVKESLTQVFPASASSAAKTALISEACERLLLSGKWSGTICEADIAVYDHPDSDGYSYITLPRHMAVALGSVKADGDCAGFPMEIHPQWYRFYTHGIGDYDCTPDGLYDMGFGFPSFREWPAAGVVTVENEAADNGDTFTVYGWDADGKRVSEAITLAGTATGAQSFTRIERVIRAAGSGYVSLYAGAVLVGLYEPTETHPDYRRYKVTKRATGDDDYAIRVRGKRAHVAPVSDSDPVYPPLVSAIRFGVMAIGYEVRGEVDAAAKHWAFAASILEQEAKEMMGSSSMGVIPATGHGYAVNTIPTIL